jgi:hypothetical protein
MKQPVDIDKFHTDAREHDDKIKDVMKQFVTILVNESEAGRTPDSETGRIAQEASDEYDRHADDIESGRMSHISEPTTEGSLRKLATELNRERGFNGDALLPADTSANALLDRLVQAVRDRRGR